MPDQRIRFTKTGSARYISHLDLMRTFQRAFLRGEIDIWHTEGFNPHAYVSMPLPLSVGFSSECEIMEFGLIGGVSKEELPAKLTKALPEGITVTKCYDSKRAVKELVYVHYIITLEYEAGTPIGAENAIRALLEQEQLVVTKKSKKAKSGFVEVDLIPLMQRTSYEGRREALVVDTVLRAQNPGMNPTLILEAIRQNCPQFAPDYVSYHRKQVLDKDLKAYE